MTSGTKKSVSHPIFTTHHPKSISDSDHGVESAESCALELCVQVASTQCHFAGRPVTLDVYAIMMTSIDLYQQAPHTHTQLSSKLMLRILSTAVT
jgi:hypothetical protein